MRGSRASRPADAAGSPTLCPSCAVMHAGPVQRRGLSHIGAAARPRLDEALVPGLLERCLKLRLVRLVPGERNTPRSPRPITPPLRDAARARDGLHRNRAVRYLQGAAWLDVCPEIAVLRLDYP